MVEGDTEYMDKRLGKGGRLHKQAPHSILQEET